MTSIQPPLDHLHWPCDSFFLCLLFGSAPSRSHSNIPSLGEESAIEVAELLGSLGLHGEGQSCHCSFR
jgi:hypothetical protein